MNTILPVLHIAIYDFLREDPLRKEEKIFLDESNRRESMRYEIAYNICEIDFYDNFTIGVTGIENYFGLYGCISGLISIIPENKNFLQDSFFSYTCLPGQTTALNLSLTKRFAMSISISNMMPRREYSSM